MKTIRIFISSPGDAPEERDIAKQAKPNAAAQAELERAKKSLTP